jgi:hypothetical protein
MWNAWTAPPGALPRDYDPWSCEAHCARCGELAQDCHCDEEMMANLPKDERALALAIIKRCADYVRGYMVPPPESAALSHKNEWLRFQDCARLLEAQPNAIIATAQFPDEDAHDIDDRTR